MSKLKYRPEIDGLRAISVLSVVLFHLDVPGVSGGFAGVDVFFVISGYLITTILKSELDGGTFSLLSFYDRRIRRIVPALLVMLLVTLAAGYLLLAPGDYAVMGASAIAAVASVSNIFFYLNTGYFDASASTMPLLHTWSLAIEEQFYVVLPLALTMLYRVHRGKYAFAVLVGLFSLSFAGGLLALSHDPKAAFYLPQYRAWELAAGSILAFLPAARANRSAALIGLALVIAAVLLLDKDSGFPGYSALLPVGGAALLLRYGSLPTSALALPPMVFIGRISYSLYLWHWPVIVLWKHYTGNAPLSVLNQIGLASLSFLLGWMSWRWIEQPFRRQKHAAHRTVGSGIGASVLVAMAALPVVTTHGFPARIPAELGNLGNRDAMWTWGCPAIVQSGPWEGLCQVGSPWDQAKARFVLTGDSHAEHFMPYIHEAAKATGVSVVLFRACPPVFTNTGTKRLVRLGPDYTAGCTKTHEQLLIQLADSPDVSGLIIASAWAGHAIWSFRGDTPPTTIGTVAARSAGLLALKQGLDELLAELEHLGKKVVVLSDMPSFDADPLHCAIGQDSGLLRQSCRPGATTISAATFGKWQAHSQRMLREVQSGNPDVTFLFPGDAMCTPTGCDAYQDGHFLYRDTDHLRRDLGPTVNRHLADRIGLTNAFETISPPAQ